MILVLLAYFGGVLTIVSPCILPVLPFVFARADRPFVSSGLPLLAGMAATFAVVATLAAVGGGWVVEANQYGRIAAIALLAVFGVTLLLPSLSDRMTRPLVALGARLSQSADRASGSCASTGHGRGVVTGQRLYQLVRQSGPIADRTFEIRFLAPAFRPMRLPSADMRGHQCPNPVQPRP